MNCMNGRGSWRQVRGSASFLIEDERKGTKIRDIERVACFMFYAACHYPSCTRYTTRTIELYVLYVCDPRYGEYLGPVAEHLTYSDKEPRLVVMRLTLFSYFAPFDVLPLPRRTQALRSVLHTYV